MKLWPSSTDWRPTRLLKPEKGSKERGGAPARAERSLRTRLLFIVLLALLPAAIVSVVQGLDRIQRDVNDVRALLVQTARATASDEQNLLASAEQILRAHANHPDVRQMTPACGEVLANAVRGLSFFPNIVRIDAGGDVVCSALPYQPSNVADREWWDTAHNVAGFFITAPAYGLVSRYVVIGIIFPLRTPDGAFDGVLYLALDVQWLDFMLQAQRLPEGAVAALFNQAGALITATDQDEAAVIFQRGVTPELTNQLLSGVGSDGAAWSYAIAPLSGSATLLGFAMPDSVLFSSTYLHVAIDLLLPALMLFLASIAIWIATDRFVLRWITFLRRMAVAYSRGHYAVRPTVIQQAPNEFRTLGAALTDMAAAVDERDRSLREAVAQKSMLIREVHHRVKNNLQIVMSLLSLQASQLEDDAARTALRETQARVNALALVHRILHDLEDVHVVDISQLLNSLARQIHAGFGRARRDIRLDVDIVSRQVTSDLAVPLTLFAVEALTNAFKHAFPTEISGGQIRLSLTPAEGEKLVLAIEDDGIGLKGARRETNVGSRLMQAFAKQINGIVDLSARESGGTRITLTFPDPLERSANTSAQPATSEIAPG
jgi:two-component sensor histidine kinase